MMRSMKTIQKQGGVITWGQTQQAHIPVSERPDIKLSLSE
jgi:hypothetical protein